MNSIDTLRKRINDSTDHETMRASYPPQHPVLCSAETLHDLLDEVEREVESDYVKLPVDADGITVHFGDVLSQFGRGMEVIALTDPDECEPMAEITSDGLYSEWVRLRKMTHYRKPTIEDILREFAEGTTGQNKDFSEVDIIDCAQQIREVMSDDRD